MSANLKNILHRLVLDSPIPAKALADEIGKPYSTLLRETNPYDAGAKLGVETMFEIIKRTHDMGPLEYMANQLGYTLVQASKPRRSFARVHGKTSWSRIGSGQL
ncbi:conserved hypothetical protein [uncultured delta proteobacterium]|uniref:Amino acid-binding protein n=1 Tax=uncultured delta proteobacterium TaxID=34034 RepID=A0A212K652_9DELT|nr:conserved hypothetical protein [uncultured delta proteobacterium]